MLDISTFDKTTSPGISPSGPVTGVSASAAPRLDNEVPSTAPVPVERMPEKLRRAVLDGRRLWDAMQDRNAALNDSLIADVVEELFAPPEGTRV